LASVTYEAPARKPGLPITEILVAIAIGAAIYFGVLRGMSFSEALRSLLSIGMAIVGIGLLIFIHELGHFLAAKWCGVKVEAFALGIGPLIPGLSFKKGETHYGLAWFPIGGYVKMLGQVDDPNDKSQDAAEVESSPRSYRNKTVGQRMLIISAGVIMNIILGLLLFIIVYFFGKDEMVGKIGTVSAGSPAEKAGIEAGSELLSVGNIEKPWYNDLNMTTALSSPGSTEIPVTFRTPRGEERSVVLLSKKDKHDVRPTVGVTQFDSNKLSRFYPEGKSPGYFGTPASQAAFLPRDEVIAIKPEKESQFIPVKNGFEIHKIEDQYREQKLIYQVKRMVGEQATNVELTVQPVLFRTLGLRMTMGPIVSVSTYQPAIGKALQVGDVIVGLGGKTDLDPVQVPDLVHQAARLGKPVDIVVKREDKTFTLTLTAKDIEGRGTWIESTPLGNAPMPIPALGVSYSVSNVVAGVEPDSPAAKLGIKPGDVLKKLTLKNDTSTPKVDAKIELGETASWPYVFYQINSLPDSDIGLTVDSGGKEQVFENVRLVDAPGWYYYSRGLILEPEQKLRVAENIWDAIVIGGRQSYRFVGQIYLNLYSLLRGSISVKLLNGPLGLAEMTYRVAKIGLIDLLHLLAVISINLAIVNFLPIPVLDGGHMMLLIAEKIRGKKLSETWEVIITYIGLAIVLTMMLGTVFLDLTKYAWFQKLFGW
jgi:regulator of sigma E protease